MIHFFIDISDEICWTTIANVTRKVFDEKKILKKIVK